MHTPGHASNHLCYLPEGTGLLFTGDHLMQGSTVVISPPDGSMTLVPALRWNVLQTHAGHSSSRPVMASDHRRCAGARSPASSRIASQREAKVVERLDRLGTSNMDTLVASVYDDVDPALAPGGEGFAAGPSAETGRRRPGRARLAGQQRPVVAAKLLNAVPLIELVNCSLIFEAHLCAR